MADVFISYAREDRTRVRSLADALSAHGWSVWWDRQIRAGQTFDQVIADALASARCVVVVWSPQSVASSWVREEAEEGRRRGILIPVLIENAHPPLGFGRIQAVELSDWSGAETSDAFQNLVADIAAILGPPHAQGTVTAGAASADGQVGAHVSGMPVPAGPVDGPSSSMDGERPGEAGTQAPVVNSPKRDDAAASAIRAPDTLRARSYFDLSDRKLRWSLATASLLAVIVFALSWLGTGDGSTSQPSSTTAPSTAPALQMNAVMTAGGKPVPSGVQYAVYDAAKDADGNRKPVAQSPASYGPPRFPLPPGRYYVTATYGTASAGTEVDVSPAEMTRQTLNLRAGILRLTSVLSAGGKPLPAGVQYDVYDAAKDEDGNRKPVTQSPAVYGPPQFPLRAGRYYVTARYGSAFAGGEVTITAGDEPTRQILDLRAGVLSLTSVLSTGGKPLPSGVHYDVYEAAKDADGNRKAVTQSWAVYGPPQFPLPAGRYYVTARYGSASADAEVTITAGDEPIRQTLDLRAGVLSLTSVLSAGGEPLASGVQYDVYDAAKDADGNRKRVTQSWAAYSPMQFPLPAGHYYVTASSPAGKADSEVAIAAGETRRVQLRLTRETDRD